MRALHDIVIRNGKIIDSSGKKPIQGYVAIDKLGKNAVKLVDRMEFSKANFSDKVLKGWQK